MGQLADVVVARQPVAELHGRAEAGPGERPPGWLFDATREGPPGRDRDVRGLAPAKADTRPGPYRIWASRRDGEQSVLIEESAAP